MKDPLEQLPDYLFEWLEKFDFETLNASQQEQVKTYFSEEDYMTIRLAMVAGENSKKQNQRKEARKEELFAALEQKAIYQKAKHTGINRPIPLWAAIAASLVLLLVSTLLNSPQNQGTIDQQIVYLRDTVYIPKPTGTKNETLIRDTVYLQAESEKTSPQKAHVFKERQPASPADYEQLPPENILRIIPPEELNSGPNKPRKASIGEDSLVKNFSFVNL